MNAKTVVATAAALFAAGTIASAVHAQGKGTIKCHGINSCKGQSSCKTQAQSSCKGQNACKGQGTTQSSSSLECAVLNGRVVL